MRSLWVSVLAGSVLVLSACGGGAKPPEAAPPSSPASPSASASASESGTPDAEVTLPAALQGTSTKAAKATVQYFIDEGNRAFASGETAAVRQTFDERCLNCESVFSNVEKVYADGGFVKGTTWVEPRFTKALNIGDPSRVGYIVQVELGPQTSAMSRGARPERFEGDDVEYLTFTLAKVDDRWSIVSLLVGEER